MQIAEDRGIVVDSIKQEEDRLYANFIYSIKTESTRKNHLKFLQYYMKFVGVQTLRELVAKPQKIIESDIKEYLVYLRNKKRISYGAAVLYLSAIKKFYYVNSDYQFKWDLINMYLGDDDGGGGEDNETTATKNEEVVEEDRPYSKEEIQKIFNAAQDIRVKIVISLLSSSGLRHGAVHILKLRDLKKIDKYQLYQITAYRKSKKYKYITFCTPCYHYY